MIWGHARKKPVEVQFREVRGKREVIATREGQLVAYKGRDYIIKGVDGEVYPIDIDIFHKTYEVEAALICSLCGHPKGTLRSLYPTASGGTCSCSCHRGD